ncbi:unnamed protein product [Schistosoma haematobium]|nr:unnamed protein product [Schistosoma haematobium]CAH8442748.1 unnamed protein product [Schistosoma haematobium]
MNTLPVDFIDYFNKFQLEASNASPEDFSDKLNLFTSLLFLICTIIITLKQYVFNSMSCYIPVHPTGKDFENFLSDYCWVHGTIPLRQNEPMPKTPEEWSIYEKQRRIYFILSKHFIR